MLRRQLFLGVALLLGALIAACGGGGGGSGSLPPHGGGTAAQKATGASIKVLIPKSNGSSSSTRKPAFISSNTQTITVGVFTVNGATPNPAPTPISVNITTSPDCTTSEGGTSCTIVVTVPVATNVVLQLETFDANGVLLGQGLIGPINTTLSTIPTQSVSVGGVPASLSITPAGLAAGDDGAVHQIPFGVIALDASGNTIIPPGAYPSPIALTISGDTNGALSLSATSIASPGPSGGAGMVTLNYDSSKTITTATVTATYGSVTASVPFAPIVYTPIAPALFVGGSMQTVTVSEAGYAGAFTVNGTSSVATVTCVPANCTPASAGGSVTLDIAPGSAAGSEAASIVDSNGGFANLPVTVTNSTGGGTLVGAPKIYKYNSTSGAANYGITVGPDGQTLWFLDRTNSAIGSVANPSSCTTSCPITEQTPFPVVFASSGPMPEVVGLQAITSASDGNLYVGDLGNGSSDFGGIYQLSCPGGSCAPAVAASLPELPSQGVTALVAAPDGNLYGSVAYGAFYNATIAGCCGNGFSSFPSEQGSFSPNMMAADASGQTMWFTDTANGQVGFFALPFAGGPVTEQPTGGNLDPPLSAHRRNPSVSRAMVHPPRRRNLTVNGFATPLNGIVLAPDGNLYVAEAGANEIDQLNPTTWETCMGPSCTFTAIPLSVPSASPMNLTIGPDGNVWFTDSAGYVGFISLKSCASGACKATEYNVGGTPWGITAGPDGDIWFTLSSPDTNGNTLGKVVLQ